MKMPAHLRQHRHMVRARRVQWKHGVQYARPWEKPYLPQLERPLLHLGLSIVTHFQRPSR